MNVIDSDGTPILTHGKLTGGSRLTKNYADKHRKPCLHINLDQSHGEDVLYAIVNWITENKIKILNVAGSRASKDPLIYDKVIDVLNNAILFLKLRSLIEKPISLNRNPRLQLEINVIWKEFGKVPDGFGHGVEFYIQNKNEKDRISKIQIS